MLGAGPRCAQAGAPVTTPAATTAAITETAYLDLIFVWP
jgi:hypothetical protein